MKSEMNGWVITRPGYKGEPERVATWIISEVRKDAIDHCVSYAPDPKAQWEKLRRAGWQCVKANVVITTK